MFEQAINNSTYFDTNTFSLPVERLTKKCQFTTEERYRTPCTSPIPIEMTKFDTISIEGTTHK